MARIIDRMRSIFSNNRKQGVGIAYGWLAIYDNNTITHHCTEILCLQLVPIGVLF